MVNFSDDNVGPGNLSMGASKNSSVSNMRNELHAGIQDLHAIISELTDSLTFVLSESPEAKDSNSEPTAPPFRITSPMESFLVEEIEGIHKACSRLRTLEGKLTL